MKCAWCDRPMLAAWEKPFCSLDCRNLHVWHGGIRPHDQLKAARERLHARTVRQGEPEGAA